MYNNFWIPRYKYELLNWLSDKYPTDRNKFKGMIKKQLYAIYYNIRRLE